MELVPLSMPELMSSPWSQAMGMIECTCKTGSQREGQRFCPTREEESRVLRRAFSFAPPAVDRGSTLDTNFDGKTLYLSLDGVCRRQSVDAIPIGGNKITIPYLPVYNKMTISPRFFSILIGPMPTFCARALLCIRLPMPRLLVRSTRPTGEGGGGRGGTQ